MLRAVYACCKNMTTNATLLTDEIVDFLYENGVSLTISLDGPQNVQDNSRVFAESGKGTFEVIMAMKTKQELKDVFSGLSSIMLVKGGIANFATVTPDFDLPVTVDTLSLSQAEPTLNRTKVHGLQADWAVTSTAGDITFAATVPSVSKELVEYFLGKTTEIAQATINNQQFKGFSAVLNSKKLNVGFALISDDGEKCLLVKRMAVYARPLFENASTTPFAFALSGTIELEDGASSGSSSEDNIAFLTKKAD